MLKRPRFNRFLQERPRSLVYKRVVYYCQPFVSVDAQHGRTLKRGRFNGRWYGKTLKRGRFTGRWG